MALYNKRNNIYIQYVIRYHTIQQNTIQEKKKKEKNHLGSLVKAT